MPTEEGREGAPRPPVLDVRLREITRSHLKQLPILIVMRLNLLIRRWKMQKMRMKSRQSVLGKSGKVPIVQNIQMKN